MCQDAADFLAGQDHGQVSRPLGPNDVVEPRQVLLEYDAIKEHERIHRLVLRRGGNVVVHGQRGQKLRDLFGAHVGRMAFGVKEDVALDPADVRLLGPVAVMAGADRGANAIEQARAAGIAGRSLAQREHDRR